MENIDEKYMHLALRLGRKGLGRTSPNPPVGAVIVRDGRILGKGWHHKAGMAHAEIEAIENAKKNGITNFVGATMYVTLEPCCHYGKTPPCADRIIEEGFSRVVIGTMDPNPQVSGGGIKKLRQAGIAVTVGVLEKKAIRLIEHFRIYTRLGRAFLAVKFAESIDGKIAASDGSSKWISSESARKFAHRLRNTHDAVMIGARTLAMDDPELTVRHIKGRNPVRIVLAGRNTVYAHHRIFEDNLARTILVSSLKNPFHSGVPGGNVEIWKLEPNTKGQIPIHSVLERLSKENIISVLLEGGSKLIGNAIAEGVADRIYAIISPKIIGHSGISSVGAEIAPDITSALDLADVEYRKLGTDFLITGRISYSKVSKM